MSNLRTEIKALWQTRRLSGIRLAEIIGPVLAGVLTMVSSIGLTVVSAWLITKAWEKPFIVEIALAVTAVRALGISRAVFRYVERLVSHRLALQVAGRTRENAYILLTNGDPRRILALNRGALLTRLGSDIDEVSEVIIRAIVPIGTSIITSLCAVIMAATLSLSAASILAAGLFLSFCIPPLFAARAIRISDKSRAQALQEYTSIADEVLNHSATLRVENLLDTALEKAHKAALTQVAATEKAAPANAWSAAAGLLIHGFTVLTMLFLAGYEYISADQNPHSPQWLGVLVLLSLAAFEAVAMLPGAAANITRASAAANRLGELITPAQLTSSGTQIVPAEPSLRTQNLIVGFDKDLASWELDLPWGSRQEIVAPSGYGKTTLLLTLAGLLPARHGTVFLAEQPISSYAADSLRHKVALSLEDAHIFSTTVGDNLLLGANSADPELIAEVLAAVGLKEWVSGLPQGLDTVLYDGDQSLSGGQRRRLLLARALLTNAPILLLDEPTEHLDPASAQELTDLVLKSENLPGARAQRSVIVVRHPREEPGI